MNLKNIFLSSLALSFYSTSAVSSNTNNLMYKTPLLILEAVAGDEVGQFGLIFGIDINWPIDFVVDPKGAIWIMDSVNERVQKFDANGNYISHFPDNTYNSYVDLRCKYIECTRDGIIVLGPTLEGYVLLNNNGTHLRNIKVPGAIPSLFDFSITPSDEILYIRDGVVVAFNIKGEVVYVTTRDNYISGENISPYSKYIVKNNPAKKITDIYNGRVKENNKINTIAIKDLPNNKANYTYRDILITDPEGNLFVRNIKNRNAKNVAFIFLRSRFKNDSSSNFGTLNVLSSFSSFSFLRLAI